MQNIMKQANGQSAHHKPQHHRFAQARCAITHCCYKHTGEGSGHKAQIMSDHNEADNARYDAADAAQIGGGQ